MLDRIFGPLARRYAWADTALTVQKRFAEVRGTYLAAAVTLNVFLSLFPLLLVAIAVIGYITTKRTDIPAQIISSLGLTGETADSMNAALQKAAETKKAASIIGLVGLLWSGLGVVAAMQYALDATWQATGRGIKDKAVGVGWALGALVIFAISVAITGVIDYFTSGFLFSAGSIVLTLLVNFILWIWTFSILSKKRLSPRAYMPGALLGAIGVEALKQITALLPGLFSGSSTLYGSLGIVFAIFATLLLFGRLVVYASVLNVISWEKHHGTLTIEIEVPKVPGEVPIEADRAGATEPANTNTEH